MSTTSLDRLAGTLADALTGSPAPVSFPSQRDLVLATSALVRRHGAFEALSMLRLTLGGVAGYHDTRTVFTVWSVDRLLAGGLSTAALLWHPLTSGGAEQAWWDAATLESEAAARHFVAPTLAVAGDPVPCEPDGQFALAG